jgi:hypothetical protein
MKAQCVARQALDVVSLRSGTLTVEQQDGLQILFDRVKAHPKEIKVQTVQSGPASHDVVLVGCAQERPRHERVPLGFELQFISHRLWLRDARGLGESAQGVCLPSAYRILLNIEPSIENIYNPLILLVSPVGLEPTAP